MLIDDDPDNLQALSALLESKGHTVISKGHTVIRTRSSLEALGKLTSFDFDTLIWPTPRNRSILLMEAEGFDGEEKESGGIRGDSEGIRIRSGTIKGVARKLEVHRRMVRQALAGYTTAGARAGWAGMASAAPANTVH
jgi:hypothetical protein